MMRKLFSFIIRALGLIGLVAVDHERWETMRAHITNAMWLPMMRLELTSTQHDFIIEAQRKI